jgi:hypothetical protein
VKEGRFLMSVGFVWPGEIFGRIRGTALIFFAKESGGMVSNFVLPKWFSSLLSLTKVKFNRRKGDQK